MNKLKSCTLRADGKGNYMKNAAEFLAEKKWGVFSHYLYHSICNPDEVHNRGVGEVSWCDAVNMFDVERVAYTLHKMNAGYYFITLMQGTRHMLAPNETYDKIAGTLPGEACATRDLPMELGLALEKYGIDLCLYYTGDGPHKDPDIGPKFGFIGNGRDGHKVDSEFCEKWASVAGEYAERYGGLVKAWWMDGMYDDLFGYTNELRGIYHKAIKKGNPDAAVAFNNGVKPGFWRVYPEEEFVCGEFNDFLVVPYNKYIEGAQAHVLAPLGYDKEGFIDWNGWSKTGLRHTKEYMRDYIRACARVGAAVSVDILTHIDGSFDIEQEAAMRWVGENL